MELFYDKLTHWQPFFSTVAGTTATLAGLLFIALSINREKIVAVENRDLLRSVCYSNGPLKLKNDFTWGQNNLLGLLQPLSQF